MESLGILKEILYTLELDTSHKSQVEKAFADLEMELAELRFLTARYKRDQKVNENFVKKTVAMLEASNESLKASNHKLLKVNEELKKSNEELERFAFIASHDLKTPLHNIINFARLLHKKNQDGKYEEVKEYLPFILEGGERMSHLIEDVLEYSKLSKENQESDRNVIHLGEMIEEISMSISEYLHDRNAVIVQNNPLPSFYGNPSKMFILFKNLIENGIKYNESPHPTIKIYATKGQEGYTLCFEDNGIGIEAEYYDRIFQMFTRLHTHDKYEGTGLGLATCKKIVDEFGGKIGLESELGVKTVFSIELPLELIEPCNREMERMHNAL